MIHRYILLLVCSLVACISCTPMSPLPGPQGHEFGSMVGKKDVPTDHPGYVEDFFQQDEQPDPAEIIRQLEEESRQFNERLHRVISKPSRRDVPAVVDPTSQIENGDVIPLSFNFYDADLQEVIRLFMTLMNQNYTLHPQVTGRVSLVVEDTFRRDQLFDLLEGILRINGMAMVRSGILWEIMPLSRVPSQVRKGMIHFPDDGHVSMDLQDIILPSAVASHLQNGAFHFPEGGLIPARGQMIQAFRLHFIQASAITTIIRPYLSDGAQVYAHDANGILLVCDFPHVLANVGQLIAIFDESVFARVKARTYPLTYALADDMVKELESIAKTFRLGDESGGVHGQVSFLPLARLNMILALARDEQVMEFIDIWVRELDRELPTLIQNQSMESIYVYYVQYGNAHEIVSSLQGLFEYRERPEDEQRRGLPASGGAERTQPDVPRVISAELPPLIRDQPFPSSASGPVAVGGELSGPVFFGVDEPNNAILIRCNRVDYPKILAIIEKLDQYPKQVLIEVIIAEVQLTDDMQLGVEWRWATSRDGVTQDLSLDTNIGGIFPTPIPRFDSGLSYIIQSTARFQAALKASAESGNLRILSTPTLLASDNKPAVINIGDEVPIPTSTLTREDDRDPALRSTETTIQYRDTGIILRVTPKINKQGMVRMELSQEVSSLSNQIVRGVDAPVISTRHTQTTVAVNDQQTIVIGGLMRQSQSDSSSGVPGLTRVPILKHLFGVERRQFNNSELMIFITPHVVMDDRDSGFISRGFLQRLEVIKQGMR